MHRFWICTTAAVALLAALPVATAHAATPTAPSAKALRALGVKVTWPLRGASPVVKPGTKLTVKVTRLGGKKGMPVKLTLGRLDAKGRATKTLRSATLRSGTFSATVPKGDGLVYALSLNAKKVRFTGRFRTPAAVKPDPQKPKPDGPTADPCQPAGTTATPAATVRLGVSTVVAGQPVPYTVTNTGTTCLTANGHYGWQRLTDAGWTFVALPLSFPDPMRVLPGATWTGADARTSIGFAPGHYRLIPNLAVEGSNPVQRPDATAELEVTDPCVRPADDPGTASGVLHTQPTVIRMFGTATYTVENTGTTCLNLEMTGTRWERRDGETWTPLTVNVAYYGPPEFTVAPGTSKAYVVGATQDVESWASFDSSWTPGHYRLSQTAYPRRGAGPSDHTQPVALSSELDLVPFP